MQCYVRVTQTRPFAGLGLWFWFMVCRRVLALHLHSYLWRYQCLFKHPDDCLYGSRNGLIYCFSNMGLSTVFPETPLTFAPSGCYLNGQNLGIYRFPWLFAGYAFTERLLDGYAPLFGIYAVSFVVIVLACALVEILNRRWFWAIPSALLVLGCMGCWIYPVCSAQNAKP